MTDKELNSRDLAREIEISKLQEENKILKENAENNDKVVDKINWENMLLKKENQELKSQLRGTTHCFDEEEHNKLKEENQELKKQLENKYEKVGTLTSELLYEENTKLINQQKEFIKYLEDGIKQNIPSLKWKHYNEDGFNDYDVENPSCIEVRPTDKIFKEVLQKYKEIIGDDK